MNIASVFLLVGHQDIKSLRNSHTVCDVNIYSQLVRLRLAHS
jgi:hypothetical protein